MSPCCVDNRKKVTRDAMKWLLLATKALVMGKQREHHYNETANLSWLDRRIDNIALVEMYDNDKQYDSVKRGTDSENDTLN